MTSSTERTGDRLQFFIDGKWVAPRGAETVTAREAATGVPLGVAALGSAADIDAAVSAARHALDRGPWGRSTVAERVAVMRRFAAALRSRGEATSRLVSRENGMPITLSESFNGEAPAALLEMYAGQVETEPLERAQPSPAGSTIVRREPVGVVGAITPWNFPQSIAIMKIAPALAAGCTVVLKHAPDTALDSYVIADAATEAGLPPGVLNIVLGDRDAGAALVSHPGVDKIAFTGSTAAGRVIGAECGRLVRRCTLELGGKSAALFCEDGDVETLLAGLATSSFMNNGQNCAAQMRLLAPRSRYGEIVDAVAGYAEAMVVGDPLDRSTTLGPMASERHLQRVQGYIDDARDHSGARLITGGGRPKGLDDGWFVAPTVFADVAPDDRLFHEEVFGPVMGITPYDTEEEAIELANVSNYGLGGSVWTADEDKGLEYSRRIRAGNVGVNYWILDMHAPFGGFKDSGIGRELGPQALSAYFEWKAIYASADRLGRD
ncbi:aldehyde dehydrogenase [Amycolatopsis jejuensis]|uniref:aldehyde dehydrogenase n=1 Tax=Amycolatopsis jejuensis TaxID=330084 RepID=UPI00052651A5|nr:aldehyde dehydrogenase [Amycolatopsis jejuensis]